MLCFSRNYVCSDGYIIKLKNWKGEVGEKEEFKNLFDEVWNWIGSFFLLKDLY